MQKNFFLYFQNFFISDWIYTPKIMTKNLSHVILSWSYRKKLYEMHILCIIRHNSKKNCKNKIFSYFQNFSFLIGFLHPKPCPTICLMSQLYDYIRKKYVSCIFFAYQGIIFKKIAKKIFFLIFKIFHFWSDFYTQNHDQQFVSCLNFMFVYEKIMWHAHPLHTKAYKNGSL